MVRPGSDTLGWSSCPPGWCTFDFGENKLLFLVSGKWHRPPRMTRMMTGWRQLCIFRQDDARMMCAQSRMTGAERRQARMMSGWRQQDDCQDDYRQNRSMPTMPQPPQHSGTFRFHFGSPKVHVKRWPFYMHLRAPEMEPKWTRICILFQFWFNLA